MNVALIATHAAAFVAGAWAGRRVVGPAMRIRQGDRMTAQARERSKMAVALIGMAVILVVFGLQVRDSNQREKDYRAQVAGFQAQQACLNRFSLEVGRYLVDTLNKRVQANGKVDQAAKVLTKASLAKDKATTAVILTVARGFDDPPTADQDDLVAALAVFRKASAALDRATTKFDTVERETKAALAATGSPDKPYDPPKVRCVP